MVRVTAAAPGFRRRTITLRDGRKVVIRSIRPWDADEILQAFARLSPRSRYLRFGQHKNAVDAKALERGLNPVSGRELTLIATIPAADGIDIVGATRYVTAPGRRICEFALTIADDWTNCGLGSALLLRLMRCAKRDGYKAIEGLVLCENEPMLSLARRIGFAVKSVPGDATVRRIRHPL